MATFELTAARKALKTTFMPSHTPKEKKKLRKIRVRVSRGGLVKTKKKKVRKHMSAHRVE